MSNFTKDDYVDLADTVNEWRDITGFQAVDWNRYSKPFAYIYTGDVVPKQRPRKGKNGKMFTPPETRKFEADVAAWGKINEMPLLTYPIRVELIIYDRSEDDITRLHSIGKLTYDNRKDLDNMQKSIFDGLNGVLYRDDKQIVDVHVRRRYAHGTGFRLTVQRHGLSKTEYTTFLKYLRVAENNA